MTSSAETKPSQHAANRPRSRRRFIWWLVGAILIVELIFNPFSNLFSDGFAPALAADAVDDSQLAKLVAEQRKDSKLVGLAAMVMVDGKVTASAASGERKRGSKARVEVGDRWHLGSITKSITATMIARLVEADKLQWTDTLGIVFADETIHDDWKPVTLHELLTHTSGAPPNFSISTQFNQPKIGKPAADARRATVLRLLANSPTTPPGKKMVYSNVGFTIAGAMAEEATGETWSELVRREVFEPLQLTTAGFGPPKSDVDENGIKVNTQPQGHIKLFGRKRPVGEDADNTAIIGPAGIVHMSLEDLCTYATEHLRGDQGKGQLLSAETYQRLHTPNLEDYAYGWVQRDARGRFSTPLYWHNGSNTMWYAIVVFVPSTNKVIVVTSNDGDIAKAEAAAWEIVAAETVAVPAPEGVTSLLNKFSKRAPFTAVRWPTHQPNQPGLAAPEVQVDNRWYKLTRINELPIAEILKAGQENYGSKYRKRFAEDLVELLTLMEHPPAETVTLEVKPLESDEIPAKALTLKDVPMTEANRHAVRNQSN